MTRTKGRDNPITQTARAVMSTVLHDEPWKDIGFTRRPRYGTRIQHLRPRWRVAFERAVTARRSSQNASCSSANPNPRTWLR